MTTGKTLRGKPYAGNPHVRLGVPMRSGHSLPYKNVLRFVATIVVSIVLAGGVRAEAVSPSGVALCVDAGANPAWNAVPRDSASVPLFWPDHAVSATVAVSNLATDAVSTLMVADTSVTQVEIAVPSEENEETICHLTVTFVLSNRTRETMEADVVTATGLGGAGTRFRPTGPSSTSWGNTFDASVVLPTYSADDDVTLGGAACASYGMWRLAAPLHSHVGTEAALVADGRSYLATLKRILRGTIVIFH